MRLWHEDIISKLPRQQLLGQHRECAALRGNGWGRKHSTVDYAFTHHWFHLFRYHNIVMNEMINRGYKPDPSWQDYRYRGLKCEPREELSPEEIENMNNATYPVYPEHNDNYLKECLDNLAQKGIIL